MQTSNSQSPSNPQASHPGYQPRGNDPQTRDLHQANMSEVHYTPCSLVLSHTFVQHQVPNLSSLYRAPEANVVLESAEEQRGIGIGFGVLGSESASILRVHEHAGNERIGEVVK